MPGFSTLNSILNDKTKRSAPLLQPLTFGGVARFAVESLGRLFLAQFLFALAASACVVTMLAIAWCPVVGKVIGSLPDNGAILNGELQWPDGAGAVMAENRIIGFALDPGDTETAGLTADQRVVLGKTRIKVSGLLGFLDAPYPHDRFIPVNRLTLAPAWGAWQPAILAGAGVGTLLFLLIVWLLLASLYCLPVRLIAMLARREATLFSCWKLAAAALLPGSLVMDGAILLYTLSPLSPVGLGLAFVFHFVTGWVFLACSPFKLAKLQKSGPAPANPFSSPAADNPPPVDSRKSKNPFAGDAKTGG